jgi:hypothetical protein
MDDPLPEDWAVGLLVIIGVGAVVAVGAGRFPDLDPGTWAQWVGGVGTILAVVVALFGDRIRGRMFGPELDVFVSTESPDCVPVSRDVPLGGPYDGTQRVDMIYMRMKIRNSGRSLARDVQVFAESVTQFNPDPPGWQPVQMFPPMNLAWSDLPDDADVKLRMFFPGLGPTMSKHCDLGRIAFHKYRRLVGDDRPGLNAKLNSFAFEILARSNPPGGYIVGPGRYRIRLLLAADNARPVDRTIELVLRPEWKPDDVAAMINIRVV